MYRNRKTTKKYSPEKSRKKIESGDKKCPFCFEIAKEALSSTKYNFVIANKFSYQYWEFLDVTEHLMIVPKRHVERLGQLNKAEKLDTMDLITKYEAEGFNIYARQGKSVIKTVPHQHTHLIKTKNKRAKFFMYLRRPYWVWKV